MQVNKASLDMIEFVEETSYEQIQFISKFLNIENIEEKDKILKMIWVSLNESSLSVAKYSFNKGMKEFVDIMSEASKEAKAIKVKRKEGIKND